MNDDDFERAKALFFEGHALFDAGRPEDAAERFEASLALVPGRASTLANLGAARVEAGRPAAALEPLEAVLALEPADLASRSYLGVALAALGRHAEALAAHDAVLALAPERAGNWLRRGQALQFLDRHADALDAYERALTLDPTLAPAWMQKGSLLRDAGRLADAARAFEQALAQGGDPDLLRYFLASVTGRDAPDVAPPAYVAPFFDEYADGFERHLVDTLDYRAPQLLVEAVAALGPRRYRAAVDLGCGTGLCGPLLRPLVARLEGVDLSARMLDHARERGVYDALVQADIAAHLGALSPAAVDLIVAADVFIYVGDLEPVFAGVARALEPGGVFAFTAESLPDTAAPGHALLPSLRYAHAEPYVRALASVHGLDVAALTRGVLRREQRVPVDGCYVVLRKPAG
jgi:predicted TPR repeat methyltransferase